jgi:hypothetical protein
MRLHQSRASADHIEKSSPPNGIGLLKRGLLRLWITVALIWIIGGAFILQHDLLADCDHLFLSRGDFPRAACELDPIVRPPAPGQWIYLADVQWAAIYWLVFPPLGALVIGLLVYWVAAGFRSQNSN